MRWRPSLVEFRYEVLYFLGLIYLEPDAISILLNPSDTKIRELVDNKIPTIESGPAASSQRLDQKTVLGTSLSMISFLNSHVILRFFTVDHISADGNRNDNFDANDWIIKTVVPQVTDDIFTPLSTLEWWEEKK